MPTFPPKLRPGSLVRVIAPSRSLAIIGPEVRAEADRKLAALGLTVSFGEHVNECDALVGAHPKVLCGFSDITALSNALYSRAGLVGYSGPHYSSFGMKRHFEYTEAGFRACVMEDGPITLTASPGWSDDAWFADQADHRMHWCANRVRAGGVWVAAGDRRAWLGDFEDGDDSFWCDADFGDEGFDGGFLLGGGAAGDDVGEVAGEVGDGGGAGALGALGCGSEGVGDVGGGGFELCDLGF
jgi:hypothetical protein